MNKIIKKRHNSYLVFQSIFILLFFSVVLSYFFKDLIFGERFLIGGEIWLEGIGSNKYNFELLKKGILPVWSPTMDLGYPIISDLAFTYWLHPINLIFCLLPAHVAHNLLIIIHFILCLFFTYLFASKLGISRFGSLITALIYTFSGFMASQTCQYCVSPALVWLPLILLFIHLAYEKQKILFFILAGIVFGFQFFQAHLQFWCYTFLMAASFIVYRTIVTSDIKKENILANIAFSLKGLSFLLGIGIGIAAIQFLPLLEISGYGSRLEVESETMSFSRATGYRMNLSDVVLLFFPTINGAHFTSGYQGFNSEYFPERWGYIGVFPLILALSAVVLNKRKEVIFFTIVMFCALFLAMACDTPLYFLQFYLLPGFDNLRVPLRYLILFCFSGAILAGFAFDSVTHSSSIEDKARVGRIINFKVLFLVSLALMIFYIHYFFGDWLESLSHLRTQITMDYKQLIKGFFSNPLDSLLAPGFYGVILPKFLLSTQFLTSLVILMGVLFYKYQTKIFKRSISYYSFMATGILLALLSIFVFSDFFMKIDSFKSIIRPLIIFLVIWLIFFLWQKQVISGGQLKYILLFVILLDVVVYNNKYILSIDEDLYTTNPNSIEFIKKDKSRFRVYPVMGKDYKEKYNIQAYSMSNETYYRQREVSFPSILYGIELFYSSSSREPTITLQRHNNIRRVFEKDFLDINPPHCAIKLFSLLNIKYLIRTEDVNSDALKLVYNDEFGVRVYENKKVMPRAFIVPDYVVLREDEILDYMKDDSFVPQKVVILEEEPLGFHEKRFQLEEESFHYTSEIVNYSNNEITIETSGKQAGFLVLSDSYYPGWKAYVNGSEAKIYQANYLMRSVFVPSGNHIVEFQYESVPFKVGLIISLLTLIFLVFYFSILLIRERFLSFRQHFLKM